MESALIFRYNLDVSDGALRGLGNNRSGNGMPSQ
jgi:hypothetical protein